MGVVCFQFQRSDELRFKIEIQGDDQVLIYLKLRRADNLSFKWIILQHHI